MDRCPALLARGGVHRQAIPGLTMDASASCLARREHTRRLMPPRAAMLGADNGEERQKPKRTATAQGNIKSAPFQPSSFPRRRESSCAEPVAQVESAWPARWGEIFLDLV